MKLREPAAKLWKKHREAVRRISRAPGGESRLLMGGGSVLAAEWGHRMSMDIDLLLPEREGMQDASQGGPVDLAAATGGKLVKDLPNQISVEVDEGGIDVAAIQPDLPGLEREVEIDGRTELVLANAQILRGKLDRTQQGAKRDAFDFAVARETDPQALEIAVNALSPNETRVVRHNLEASDNKWPEASKTRLRGVHVKYAKYAQAPGQAASKAVAASRYIGVEIGIEGNRLRISTRTRGDDPRIEEYSAKKAAAALQASGIDAYLRANSRTLPRRLVHTIHGLAARNWKGAVFDNRNPSVAARAEATAYRKGAIRKTGSAAMRPGEGSNERETANETRTPGDVPFLPDGGTPAKGRRESPARTAKNTVQRVGRPKVQTAIGGGANIPMPAEAPSRADGSAKKAADKAQEKGKERKRE